MPSMIPPYATAVQYSLTELDDYRASSIYGKEQTWLIISALPKDTTSELARLSTH